MNPEMWKLVASIGGLLITTVTAPFIWAMRAEARAMRREIELVEARIKLDLAGVEARIKLDLAGVKTEMTEMEARLNERISDKLNEHGERIRSLEERRFR